MSAPPSTERITEAVSMDPADPTEPTWFWWMCNAVCRLVMVFMFDLKVYGRQHVPRRGGVLLISNHQSYLDPVLVGVYLRRPMSYMAKSELFQNKYFTWLIRSLNAFPIRQGAGDIGAIKETVRRLKAGQMLCVFAEGTRTESGDLLPIEPGAALVVRRAGVPTIPCVIQGSFEAWPRSNRLFRSYPISVMYGPPLQVQGLKAEAITKLIDRTLRQMMTELREIRSKRWPTRP
jgi:1-acyl-sn-glycerol-3-phosphate acyltransferase